MTAGPLPQKALDQACHLVQRRVDPGDFTYLAIKQPRGFVAPPAVDPESGSLDSLRSASLRGAAW